MDLQGIPIPFLSASWDIWGSNSVPDTSTTGDDDSTDESICHECRQVDWDSLVALGEDLQQEKPSMMGSTPTEIRTLRASREELAKSSCKICRILSVVKHPSLDDIDCILEARSIFDFSGLYSIRDLWPQCKTTAIRVCQKDSSNRSYAGFDNCLAVIKRDSLNPSSRIIDPSPRSVDFDWLKRLAQSCEENHEKICSHSPLGPVSGLKVIEASSRTVTEAPAECRYVALSYVWGKQTDSDDAQASNLQNPPPLIEDALSVTISMGYEYLWIDKYCIPQTDNQEKRRMINQMGQIYANASLTIIDASNGGVQIGLPGVSNSRRPQRRVFVGNTAIVELPCGQRELIYSNWATRGWTYQESYFSQRRLVFTPNQILFLCNRDYAEEFVWRLSQQVVTDPAGMRFSHLIHSNLPSPGGDHVIKLKEYSKRHLSHPSDSLNAFLGILNFDVDASRSESSPMRHVSFGLVVQKEFCAENLRIYLNWYHETPPERRHGFPTWSWAAWGGPLKFGEHKEGVVLCKRGNGSQIPSHVEWEVSWESQDHNRVTISESTEEPWSTSYNAELHQQSDYPTRLDVTCRIVPMRFEALPRTETERTEETEAQSERSMESTRVVQKAVPSIHGVLVFQFVEGVRIATWAYLDQGLCPEDRIIGLIYAEESPVPGGSNVSFGCILARQLNEGVYERVGAIPSLLRYTSGTWERTFPHGVFLDNNGRMLDEVKLPAARDESLFSGIGERGTVSLV